MADKDKALKDVEDIDLGRRILNIAPEALDAERPVVSQAELRRLKMSSKKVGIQRSHKRPKQPNPEQLQNLFNKEFGLVVVRCGHITYQSGADTGTQHKSVNQAKKHVHKLLSSNNKYQCRGEARVFEG